MEQVTNTLNISELLQRLKESKLPNDFQEILEILTISCIGLEINQRNISEKTIERVIGE